MAIRAEEASAVVEAALEAVTGFVDPVAHALAARVAATNDAAAIARALAPAFDAPLAARVAAAVLARERLPEGDDASDDDGAETVATPAWASVADVDAALPAFAAWVAPDDAEETCARGLAAKLHRCAHEVVAFSQLELYGSRSVGVALFDSDVDLRLADDLELRAVAEAVDDAPWSAGVELIAARVPLVKGSCRDTGLAFDVSRASDGRRADGTDATPVLADVRKSSPAFAPVVRFLKVLLRQRGLDDVYSGGLGSFRLCGLVASALERRPAATPARLLFDVFETFARPAAYGGVRFRGVDVDLGCLDDPRALAAALDAAAAAVRARGLAAALDVAGLARARERSRAKAAAFCRSQHDDVLWGPPAKKRRGPNLE